MVETAWPQTSREFVQETTVDGTAAYSANMSEGWFVYTGQYDMIVRYKPAAGDQFHIAHTLSCASQLESTSQADEFEVHFLLQISKEEVNEFKDTITNPVLLQVKKVIWQAGSSTCQRWRQNYKITGTLEMKGVILWL